MYQLIIITDSKLPNGANNILQAERDYNKEQADSEIMRFSQLGSDMYYSLSFPDGGQVLIAKKDILVFQLTPMKQTGEKETQEMKDTQGG